jgi:Family of unknown function (DUF6804)/DnaJ domain
VSGKWRDYYRILGVRHDATQGEIKEAYLFGVKAFHPDKFAGSSERQQAFAQERTKAANEAYEILSDATQRANYDREYARKTRAESTSPPPPRPEPPPEPGKTASSADTSAKDNSAQATQTAKPDSPPEQSRSESSPALLYGAGLYVAWLIAAAMLVSAAVQKHPYSFYMLLRWVCCAAFAWSAFIAHEKNRQVWAWAFGAVAVLYNPIVLVYLNRSTWVNVNWFTVGVIVVAAVAFLPRRAQIWIGAMGTILVIIAALVWIAAQLQTSNSGPRATNSAPAIDFHPDSPPSIPRAIPRAIPVSPTTITSETVTDSQAGNIFDQFDAPPSNISTHSIDFVQREEEEKAIHNPIDYQRGQWTTATGKAFAVAKFFERNLGDRKAELDALADQLGAQKRYVLIEKQKRGSVWWVRVFLYKR